MVDVYTEAAEVLRMVLDYLRALSPDALNFFRTPSPSSPLYRKKCRRSIVRHIGSSLPLKPAKRICFQIVQNEAAKRRNRNTTPSFIDEDCNPIVVANLADIPWLDVCSPEKTVRRRSEFRAQQPKKNPNRRRTIHSFKADDRILCTPRKTLHTISEEPLTPVATPDPKAMQKIDALEAELANLRAQIALIVTVQQNQQTGANYAVATPTPPPPPPPIPFSLSPTTPVPPPPMMGAPPPPPPPPPPMALANNKPTISVAEQIRRNKAKSGGFKAGGKTGVPNMADVLKGLGTVKLKSIARSPGGTPIRQAPRACVSNDPAALIAQALKKKFAKQRATEDSPDNKENMRHFTPSPKRLTPVKESPKFGQHLLKPSNGKRKSLTRQSRPLVDVNV